MKKILILGRDTTIYKDMVEALSDAETRVDVCLYENLGFLIHEGNGSIVRCDTGEDVKEYDCILVLSTSIGHLQNYIFSALACYCRRQNITILDDSFSNTDGKLYAMWKFWEDSLNVPDTAFGPAEFLVEQLDKFGGVGVLKSVQGTRGMDNYLVHSGEEVLNIIKNNPDIHFILQNFIPNDGDWRIIVLNYDPKMGLYRHRAKNSSEHRNNTSVGGQAEAVSTKDIDARILDLAAKASRSLGIKIAGADVLQSSKTGECYVLEVNRTPQLATGYFYEEKFAALKELIHTL